MLPVQSHYPFTESSTSHRILDFSGDVLELGENSKEMHIGIGQLFRRKAYRCVVYVW